MKDFTVKAYKELMDALVSAGYEFQTFRDYLKNPLEKVVILRHDVDKKPGNSLRFAEIEHEKGLSDSVIGCAIAVHKEIGEGCLEKVYEKALCVEFDYQGIKYRTQVPLPVVYRGQIVGDFIADLIVEGKILLELKACSAIVPVHEAQLINYLKLSGLNVGYVQNFGYPGALKFKRLVR